MSESVPTRVPGGHWDDTELIRAYDAAMEEFHLHHPGPGSWLDKATAALAQGQPLPGAKTFGSQWYSKQPEAAPTKTKKRRNDPVQTAINPYTSNVNGLVSPRYQPPSPTSDTQDAPPAIPPLDSNSTADVTYDEAIVYAMSAQYSAGYWLGVAHAKAAGRGKPNPTSNLIQTQAHFQPTPKLKR